jgi:signal transduction histidine kinase
MHIAADTGESVASTRAPQSLDGENIPMASQTGRHSGIRHGLLATAAFLLAFGVTLAARTQGSATTYPGHSVILASAYVVAGLSLIAAGLTIRRDQPRLATLSAAAALVWLAGPLHGWQGGPALVRSVGMLASSLVFAVVSHLVLVAGFGTLTKRLRLFVTFTYLTVAVTWMTLILVGDPFLDPNCFANCSPNPYVLVSFPDLAQGIARAQTWLISLASVMLIGVSISGLLRRDRLRSWEVLPGGILFAATIAAHGLLLWRVRVENPDIASFWTVFFVQCVALALISLGLSALRLASARRRRRVGQIVKELTETPPPGALEAALAGILGDPELRVYYWLPGAGYFADADGEKVPIPDANGSLLETPLVREGHTVAVITHRTEPGELERNLGPAFTLALDNERLQAEIRARARDLAESRTRIVESGDARRQSLERDLHDGVQQSLLAMAGDLERARASAEERGDQDAVVLIDHAIGTSRDAFRELREIAHGIYPSVLAAAGLCAALGSLVDNDRLAVQVACDVDRRLPGVIETACYVLAAATVEAAAAGSATRVVITASRQPESVILRIEHDGADVVADLHHLEDRVGAAGGRMKLTDQLVEAEFPCG